MTATINMAAVVVLARKGLPKGVPCYVEMSGGNCATIYVGEPYEVDSSTTCYPVMGGCGTYRPLPPTGYVDDFSIGYDQDCEGDEARTFERPHPHLDRETRAAFAIVELYAAHPRVKAATEN